MFGKRDDKEQKGPKLSGPKDVSGVVQKYLTSNGTVDPEIVPFLKQVVKSSEKGGGVYDIYIYDPADAEARGIQVKNYDILKANPNLIIAEGWFDEGAKKAELVLKNPVPKIKFLTYNEILTQIEGLQDSGSRVFFYINAGTGAGGPLGRGAALIKLNAPVEGKKIKKYTAYGVSIIDMQPGQNEIKIFDSDRADQIAKWVSESHKPRFC